MPRLFRKDTHQDTAHSLYVLLVEQARRPEFYRDLGVPDTLDGRFDMIALHAYLVMRRLKGAGDVGPALAQAVFDIMFGDFDQSLREMGVGDLGVGKRIKIMAAAFYGRVAAYDEGLSGGRARLMEAVSRNLFGTTTPDPAHIDAIAGYIERESSDLAKWPDERLLAGDIAFGAPSGAQS